MLFRHCYDAAVGFYVVARVLLRRCYDVVGAFFLNGC